MSWNFYVNSGGTGGKLPPPPSRDTLLNGICRFQGVKASTKQWGDFNQFGPELNMLDLPSDRLQWYYANRKAGSTLCQIGWAGGTYVGSDGWRFPVPGPDMRWVNDLDGFCDRLAEIILQGQFDGYLLMLPGDGITQPNPNKPDYNEYGNQFIFDQLPRLSRALRNYRLGDLTQYGIIGNGYDGVVWTWPEQQVYDWGTQFRKYCPDGYAAVLYGAGIVGPGGEGKAQYTQPGANMQGYDLIQQQTPIRVTDNLDQSWQIGARLSGPAYRRGQEFHGKVTYCPAQPADDDPRAPYGPHAAEYLLSEGTPRGRYGLWWWEGATYRWVRGWADEAECQDYRDYEATLGWHTAG